MANENLENLSIRFIASLLATFRRISLYPAQHPSVISSIQNVHASLQEIFHIKNSLSISLSPDNKLLIEGKALPDKSAGPMLDIMPHLKNFEIETLIFSSGTDEKEIQDFVTMLTIEAKLTKQAGDINKTMQEHGIQHIRVEQFSYVKIKKDQEALVVEGDAALISSLKTKLQDYQHGKITSNEEIGTLQQKVFELAGKEIKEKKRLSTPVRNMLKKYILQGKEIETLLAKLKEALVVAGCSLDAAGDVIEKLKAEITEKPSSKPQAVASGQGPELKKEAQELEEEIVRLRQELEAKAAQLQNLEQQDKSFAEEKQKIENIVRHMADGIVVVDPQGKILMLNPTGEALLGISRQDIGRPLREVVKDEHLLALVKESASGKDKVVQQDIELISANESNKKVLRASSAIVEDQNGKAVGMVTVLNDITKQKELDALKSNFVANVSHELRTPLVAMEKSISLILSKTAGPVTPDQEEFLSITERNLKRLGLLINDLLDLSKFEAGKIELKRQPTSIDKVISESVATLTTWAQTKAITVEKKIQQGLPEVNIDPNRIIQVLNNLIGNAIKYSLQNTTITIDVTMSEETNSLQVSVKDQGIGIAPENLPKIFSKFYQVGERAPTDIGGTGIGLSIAKEIVELHGGKIWAESKKSEGSSFNFTLPL